MSKQKILMVGTQGRLVSSGPGTFMRYISEAIKRGDLSAEILYPHSKKNTPYGDEGFVLCSTFANFFYLNFPGSWIFTALYLWWKLRFGGLAKRYQAIWFADRFSALFCALDPGISSKALVMVNDDTRINVFRARQRGAGRPMLDPSRWLGCVFYFFERFICKRCRKVISNSDYLTELLEREYSLEGKVIRLYKAVDLRRFSPSSTNDFLMNSEITILFLKNEWFRGGLDVLVEALSMDGIGAVRLKIAGMDFDTEVSKIKEIVLQSGFSGEVDYLGRVARKDVPDLIRRSSVFCVPSRIEALGVAFLEAMACGISVIATDTGGIPEVLANGQAGWLVAPEDASALNEVLREVVNDRDLRERKRAFGLDQASKFSTNAMVSNINEITKEI